MAGVAGYWTLLKYSTDAGRCPTCSKILGKNALFCIRCGTKFTDGNGELDERIKKLNDAYWRVKIDDFKKRLPQNVFQNLEVTTDKKEYKIIVVPKNTLDNETFLKVDEAVKMMLGEYVNKSEKKYWQIPG
jgi:hypothetical protein